jgi:hypothetical protein
MLVAQNQRLKAPARNVQRPLLCLSAAAVFAAMHVLAVSQALQAGAESGGQNTPIIRSTTRLINVNIVVTDRAGGPSFALAAGGRGFGLVLAFDFGCPMFVP